MDQSDYLNVLKALNEIPFNVGRQLLVDFLKGNKDNESISRNYLSNNKSFGSLNYEDHKIIAILDILIKQGLVRYTTVKGKKFWKVLELTEKGKKELENPSLQTLNAMQPKTNTFHTTITEKVSHVTDNDRIIFQAFGEILSRFNDEQKKAIISSNKKILCIAGAGSGKTTVLTKRIEFLINYRSISQKNILAITFTRKARIEMMQKLAKMPSAVNVKVETFNSFCEQLLKNHNDKLYDRPVRVIEYREKFTIMNKALSKLNISMTRAIDTYFTHAQRYSKTQEQLANIFMNDCFFIRDYMKLKSCDVNLLGSESSAAKLVFDICEFIDKYMSDNGLRDFADQLLDTIKLFDNYPDLIPKFTHVLIDEYQDVNSIQIKLVDLLNSENIFAVGDPRQSIYGWRGSDIRHLMNFSNRYPDCELLMLNENYRSTKNIVELINASIKNMELADLKSTVTSQENEIKLLKFDTEEEEFEFIVDKILSSKIQRKEIFVLARTNRQLVELSSVLSKKEISHVIRSDEIRRSVEAKDQDITLATIHAIKGLEAEMVFVIGCTIMNFPCKGTEHPVVEMVKLEEYDKEEEEKRLFYVAMSRAKKTLFLTYCGKQTAYITNEMLKILDKKTSNNLDNKSSNKSQNRWTNRLTTKDMRFFNSDHTSNTTNKTFKTNATTEKSETNLAFHEAKTNSSSAIIISRTISRLKEWRLEVSKQNNVAAFMILHDATINDLASKMPLTLEELQNVHGLGPNKIMKYGNQILEILNEF